MCTQCECVCTSCQFLFEFRQFALYSSQLNSAWPASLQFSFSFGFSFGFSLDLPTLQHQSFSIRHAKRPRASLEAEVTDITVRPKLFQRVVFIFIFSYLVSGTGLRVAGNEHNVGAQSHHQ